MQDIVNRVGKYRYTEPQGLMLLAKELIKIGDILREYEGTLR